MFERDITNIQKDQKLDQTWKCYKNSMSVIIDNTTRKASFVLNGIPLFYGKDDVKMLNKDSKNWYYGISNIDEKIAMHEFFLKEIKKLLAVQRIQVFQESQKEITGKRIYDFVEKKDLKYHSCNANVLKIIDPFGAYPEYKAEKKLKKFIRNSILACEGTARFINKIEQLIVYYKRIYLSKKNKDREKGLKLIDLMTQINIELNLFIKNESNLIDVMSEIIEEKEGKKIVKNFILSPLAHKILKLLTKFDNGINKLDKLIYNDSDVKSDKSGHKKSEEN